MRLLRKTVADLQEETRRNAQERDQIRAQLDRTHRELAEQAARQPERSHDEDRALLDLRRECEKARAEAAEAARESAALRTKLQSRDVDLRAAAQALEVLERRCDEADRLLAERASRAARDSGRDDSATGLAVGPEADDAAAADRDLLEDTGTGPGVPQADDPDPASLPAAARRLAEADVPAPADDEGPGRADSCDTQDEPPLARAARAPAAPPAADNYRAAEPQDPSFPEVPGVRIERLVSDGPLGRVFDARETPSRRPVSVRMLASALRLLDGKRLDSLLLAKHPNLVSVLNFAVSRDGPYLVLERTEGETAEEWVRRVGPLPEKVVLAVALECARGLRQAAFHGAVHEELSPAHVWIDAAGAVRVSGAGQRPILSPNDGTCAAPQYASPERLRGSPPPDARSDIWSLGCVMWFLLAGKPPFVGDKEAVQRHQAAGAPSVREARPDVSADTAKLLQRMTSTDPDQRHMTWDQLLVDLERRVPGRVSEDLRGNLAARARRLAIAHPWVVPAAIAGLLAIAVAVHLALGRDDTAAVRFATARTRAEQLAAQGDRAAAREIYRRWLSGVGDPSVERAAAKRFDQLGAEMSSSK
ncbi:MAG: hypothetical protein HMLKMBBP_03100 [Planctomycetes bacterium]|nr:hypothetical protein [Planctomycetota bacterium]